VAFGGGGGRSGGSGVYGGSRSNAGAKRVGSYNYAIPGIGNEYDRMNNNKKSKEMPKPSGRNISTPQIVFILTLIFSLGFVGYYIIQFYPFICSSEKKYDVMSRSSVTPTNSREFEYDETSTSATKSTNASYCIEHDV
jgi:hypothetical protein